MLIAGPTASGKSALALKLAQQLDGEIVNADSMQVYRELRIVTARPLPAEEEMVAHHLYGCVSVTRSFSVAEWVEAAAPVIKDIRARKRLPIIVGGTGLYFRALLTGLTEIPEIDPAVRDDARRLVLEDLPAAYSALEREDPSTAARLAPADRQRIARALEVKRSTGRSLTAWQSNTAPGPLAALDRDGKLMRVVLLPDRGNLYGRIDARFVKMTREGALEEIAALPETDGDLPALKALGIPHLQAHLAGQLSLEEAVALAQTATRQYAKRQMTWFRNQFPDWHQIKEKEIERMYDIIFSKIPF